MSETKTQTILMVAPEKLKESHPALAPIMMQEELIEQLKAAASGGGDNETHDEKKSAAAMWDGLIKSVAEHGIRNPVKAIYYEAEDRYVVVDGRHRVAALLAALEKFGEEGVRDDLAPVVIVAEVDALSIIEAENQRRHFSKSAIAWMAVNLHPDVAVPKEEKRSEDGTIRNVYGCSQVTLAQNFGISVKLVEWACEFYRICKNDEIEEADKEGYIRGLWAGESGLRGILDSCVGVAGTKRGKGTRPPVTFKTWQKGVNQALTNLSGADNWNEVARKKAKEIVKKFVAAAREKGLLGEEGGEA